jgi:hypothetical protein
MMTLAIAPNDAALRAWGLIATQKLSDKREGIALLARASQQPSRGRST